MRFSAGLFNLKTMTQNEQQSVSENFDADVAIIGGGAAGLAAAVALGR